MDINRRGFLASVPLLKVAAKAILLRVAPEPKWFGSYYSAAEINKILRKFKVKPFDPSKPFTFMAPTAQAVKFLRYSRSH